MTSSLAKKPKIINVIVTLKRINICSLKVVFRGFQRHSSLYCVRLASKNNVTQVEQARHRVVSLGTRSLWHHIKDTSRGRHGGLRISGKSFSFLFLYDSFSYKFELKWTILSKDSDYEKKILWPILSSFEEKTRESTTSTILKKNDFNVKLFAFRI